MCCALQTVFYSNDMYVLLSNYMYVLFSSICSGQICLTFHIYLVSCLYEQLRKLVEMDAITSNMYINPIILQLGSLLNVCVQCFYALC